MILFFFIRGPTHFESAWRNNPAALWTLRLAVPEVHNARPAFMTYAHGNHALIAFLYILHNNTTIFIIATSIF